jgi:iron complex outermembrane receptor protein
MKRIHGDNAALGIVLCSLSLPALAGVADAAADTDPSAGAGALETIVVTAQKREENIQTVPIAVTAITGAALENQGITSIQGLANSMPNVQINSFTNSPDSAVFTIRGVGVNDADPYVGTTVSVVLDGVPVGVNTSALASLFDIDRVEVLRGPQGTLFGANTTGGVINVITKQPTGEYGGDAQVVVGNFGRLDANIALNFPITDELAGKISLLHSGYDGFFTNVVNGERIGRQDNTDLRGYLKYHGGGYTATLILEYDRQRDGSQSSINISDPSQLLYDPGVSSPGAPTFRRGQSLDQPDENNKDTYSVTLNQEFATPIGDWVSISNFRKYESDLYSDDAGLPFPALETHRVSDQYQYSEEARSTWQPNDRAHVTYGLFGFGQQYVLDQSTKLDGFDKGLGQPQTQFQKNWSISGFSQGYYKLTDSLQVLAGLRFQHEKTTAVSTTANTFTATPGAYSAYGDPIIPGSLLTAAGAKDWNNLGYKLGLEDQFTDRTMAYASYTRGFKSGGFTGRIANPQDIGPFNPEHLDTFEIGVKSDMLERRLRVNADVFYNLYHDMQVTQNITYTDGKNSASIVNAGAARTKGVEVELTAVPVESLTLTAYFAGLDARYTKYDTFVLNPVTDQTVAISYAGNRLMNSPKWSGGAGVSYGVAVGSGKAVLSAQDNFTTSKYTAFDDAPQELVGFINLINATVNWMPQDERWSVGLYGRNLADRKYYGQKLYLAGTFAIASVGAPLEFGLDLKFKW